jgi:hypothetical protein
MFAVLAFSASLAAAGCGDSDGDSDDSSGGSSAAGRSNEGGETAVGGDGSGGAVAGQGGDPGAGGNAGGTGNCPLGATARERAEAIVNQAVSEAGWITGQTHGSGEFASRGFGFAIPLTTVGSIVAITLVEQCTEPKTYDEYCDMSQPDLAATPCSQLECLAAGELGTTLWFEPVPFTTPADPPDGNVEIVTAEQSATFLEQADESIVIEWNTDFELVPEDEDAITIAETGTATANPSSGEAQAEGTITIAGLTGSNGDLVVEYVASAEDRSGAGTVDGQEVFTLTHDGVAWSDACSTP